MSTSAVPEAPAPEKKVAPRPPQRQALTTQAEAQEKMGGFEWDKKVHTLIRYRDLEIMEGALKSVANKTLPNKEARIHVAKCIRSLKDHLDDYKDEQRRLAGTREPENADGRSVSAAAIQLARDIQELGFMVAAVRLLKPITPAMLPENTKDIKNNEEGLSAIIADLLHYFPLDLEEDYAE